MAIQRCLTNNEQGACITSQYLMPLLMKRKFCAHIYTYLCLYTYTNSGYTHIYVCIYSYIYIYIMHYMYVHVVCVLRFYNQIQSNLQNIRSSTCFHHCVIKSVMESYQAFLTAHQFLSRQFMEQMKITSIFQWRKEAQEIL